VEMCGGKRCHIPIVLPSVPLFAFCRVHCNVMVCDMLTYSVNKHKFFSGTCCECICFTVMSVT